MQSLDLSDIKPPVNGWAIECRLNAEDPLRNFAPSSGVLGEVVWPEGITDTSSGSDSSTLPFSSSPETMAVTTDEASLGLIASLHIEPHRKG